MQEEAWEKALQEAMGTDPLGAAWDDVTSTDYEYHADNEYAGNPNAFDEVRERNYPRMVT